MTPNAPGRYGETVFADTTTERGRLTTLAAVFDPCSMHWLNALDITPGTRCLEIGPGAGTVTRWLADRAAPGEVVAVDRDTAVFGDNAHHNITLVQSDVTDPDTLAHLGQFDLIYARAVLMNLRDRDTVLRDLTNLLRHDGRIMIADAGPMLCRSQRTAAAMEVWWAQAAELIGTDPDWARRLPDPLIECGLTDIATAIDVPVVRGCSPYARFIKVTMHELTKNLTADGTAPGILADYLPLLDDPTHLDWPMAMTTAWGRRPPSPPGMTPAPARA